MPSSAWRLELRRVRSEEHTSELQSPTNLVCRLLLEKTKRKCDSVAPLIADRRADTLICVPAPHVTSGPHSSLVPISHRGVACVICFFLFFFMKAAPGDSTLFAHPPFFPT